MSTNVNIQNTEKFRVQSTTTTAQVVESKPVNSVHTVQEQSNVQQTSEVTNISKLDELLEKMCNELNNLKITPNQLKNSGILYRITGCNEDELLKKPKFVLERTIECLKEAINQTVVDGKIDLEEVGTLANKYYVAVNTGWKISEYKKHKNTESLDARLERFFGLDKKDPPVKLSSLPKEKIEEYVERYFHGYFLEKIQNGMGADKAYKLQIRDFGILLNNTSDENKAIFKTAIKSLCVKNQDKGLEAVLMSFETSEACTNWADSWTVKELDELKQDADVEGNIKTSSQKNELDIILARKQSEERRNEIMQERIENAQAYFTQDLSEILPEILDKVAQNIELTEAEKLVYNEYSKHNSNISSEYLIALDYPYTNERREEILDSLSRQTYDLPVYKSVLENVKNYISENPDVLNLSYDDIVKILDKATNGNYSIIANGEDKPLNPPAEIKTPTEAENADLGLPNTDAVDTSRLETLREQVASTQEGETGFIVEKSVTQDNKSEEEKTVLKKFQLRSQILRKGDVNEYKALTNESSFSIARNIFVNIGEACQKAQDFATQYLENASFAMQRFLLNGISHSQIAMKVAAKTIDLSNFNLNLSVTTEKAVEKIQEQQA